LRKDIKRGGIKHKSGKRGKAGECGKGEDRSFGKVEKMGKFEEINTKKGNFGEKGGGRARGEIFWAKVNRKQESEIFWFELILVKVEQGGRGFKYLE
jgi:hypothetical protein